MAWWVRDRAGEAVACLIHHNDAGSGVHRSAVLRASGRRVGALASIGSVGTFDNAMAESVVRFHKSECGKIDGPFRTVDELELATLSWVHWFNNDRLSGIRWETPHRDGHSWPSTHASGGTACDDQQHESATLTPRVVVTESGSSASSRIERIYADLDEVARAGIGEQATNTAVRTVASIRALGDLTASCNQGGPLTETAILRAHGRLLEGDPLGGQFAGRYRIQQNWIGGSDFTPRGAVHVPPPHDLVADRMADLVDFANRDDLPALAQAALVHGQFEAIHPFTDGNGRVGRGIISASLRRRGVTRTVVVPVAAAMLADVDTYFDRLRATARATLTRW